MLTATAFDERFSMWIAALEARHLRDLTPTEVARALRALSSCYVERRGKLAAGNALGSAGKRAAFGLFYAPLHFLVTRHVVRALGAASVRRVIDLGCGTGAAGAAWALEAGGVPVNGFDRHPWAVAEAAWTYHMLGLPGRARQADLATLTFPIKPAEGVIAAYAINELVEAARTALLPRLVEAGRRGARVIVIEPIARRAAPWWAEWVEAFGCVGGRADEWRFEAALPERQLHLAHAAGLDPKELTARSLCVGGVRSRPA